MRRARHALGFRRFVAELLQGHGGLGQRSGRHARRRHGDRTAHDRLRAVAQIDHDTLAGLLADARDAGQRAHGASLDRARELFDAGTRQDRQRDLRADAGHPLHVAEQAPLGFTGKAVQRHRVLLLRVVREQRDFLAQHRQLVEGAHRRFEFIADAIDVQHQPRRRLVRKHPPETTDHLRLQASFASMPIRCALARTWAWVMAMARASAASACSRPLRPSMAPTMCCTWALSAAPLPTRASFTWRAPYSLTGRSCMTTAQIAAPRAWPSLSAESAFFDTNTCSIATSSGRCSSMTARSPSSSLRSRSGRSPGAAAARASRSSGAWNTWVQRPAASTSMMPTP